jgi:hypothetical protein
MWTSMEALNSTTRVFFGAANNETRQTTVDKGADPREPLSLPRNSNK